VKWFPGTRGFAEKNERTVKYAADEKARVFLAKQRMQRLEVQRRMNTFTV
jgi:hypothetical protein